MAKIYALPMFVFRPMFFTIRNFKKALIDVIMSRRAIRNMNTLYPDATPEELRLSDNICIICREDMVNHSKKLPCGHIFHTTCLRSWFQRQQTCPTCRLNILRAPSANSTAMPRQEEAGGAAAAGQAAGVGTVPAAAPAAPIQSDGADRPRADAPASPNATNIPGMFNNLGVGNAESNPLLGGLPTFPSTTLPNFQGMPVPTPFMMPPPFPFIAPIAIPPPPMPSDLSSLSDDELRLLEGNERRHIEERIKLLRNIELMINAAGILMNNYQVITARSHPVVSPPTETSTSSTSNINDGPSTSAAAQAALSAKQSDEGRDTDASSAVTKNIDIAESSVHPQHDHSVRQSGSYAVPTSESSPALTPNSDIVTDTTSATVTAEQPENAELSELRKRRLKFLEELSKSTTQSAETTPNTSNV